MNALISLQPKLFHDPATPIDEAKHKCPWTAASHRQTNPGHLIASPSVSRRNGRDFGNDAFVAPWLVACFGLKDLFAWNLLKCVDAPCAALRVVASIRARRHAVHEHMVGYIYLAPGSVAGKKG